MILEKSIAYLPREGKVREGKETTTPTPPDGGGGGGGGGDGGIATNDTDDLRQLLVAQARQSGKKNPATWAAGAIRRIEKEGLDADTAAELAEWRQRTSAACSRAALAPDAPEPRATGAGLRKALAAAGMGALLP